MSLLTQHIGSQMVDLGSALLLLTCFAIVAQRRLSACVDLFALQSVFLALTAALVAFLTGIHHIYIAAALTIIIKAVVDEARGTLTFNFYGTKPDWTVEVIGPNILKETPPPAPIYQQDSSLAVGEVRQVEFAKNGVDVTWRRVLRDNQGQVLSEELLESSYTPWPSYYLVGPSAAGAEQPAHHGILDHPPHVVGVEPQAVHRVGQRALVLLQEALLETAVEKIVGAEQLGEAT